MTEELEDMVDFEMGKVYLGRDHDTFLKRFVEIDLQVYIKKLQNTLDCLEYDEIIRCCDSLFSTSAYVGIKPCQEISKKIIEYAKKNNGVGISDEISKLIEYSDKIELYLKEYFNSINVISSGENIEKTNSISIEEGLGDTYSFRLKPPIKQFDDLQVSDREEEVDPYQVINQEWKCFI